MSHLYLICAGLMLAAFFVTLIAIYVDIRQQYGGHDD